MNLFYFKISFLNNIKYLQYKIFSIYYSKLGYNNSKHHKNNLNYFIHIKTANNSNYQQILITK